MKWIYIQPEFDESALLSELSILDSSLISDEDPEDFTVIEKEW